MNIHLGPTAQVPYLSQSAIKEFASLIVYSEDGTEFQFNTLLLVSWSSFWKDILEDIFGDEGIKRCSDSFLACLMYSKV